MPLASPTEKQSRIIWFSLTGLAIAAVAALVVGAVWGLGKVLNILSPVIWPLAIAAVLACLLAPLVDYFERKSVPRTRAILLVFAVVLAIFLGVLASIIPQVVVETKDLVSKIPKYTQTIQSKVSEFIAQPPDFLRHVLRKPADSEPAGSPQQTAINSATDWLTGSLPKIGGWLWDHVIALFSGFDLLAGIVLIPVYAFYFLLEQRRIKRHWKEYLPLKNSRAKEEVIFVLDAISGYLIAFFRGQVMVAITDGILYTIGFFAIGLNYSFLLGMAAMVLTMIPFLGAIIICVAALVLSFVQYGDWLHPVLVLAVFAVVQSLEALVISPKIMGDRVGLHPMVIIVAVMAGTTLLGGILGGILAIPFAAALRVILFRYVWKAR